MATTQALFTEHLTSVLRDIVHNQQTGVLSIEHLASQGVERGEIFFEDGQAILARTQQEWGEQALFHIGNWSRVYYSFFTGVASPIRTSSHSGERSLNSALQILMVHQTEPITPPLGIPAVPKFPFISPIRTTPLPRIRLSPLSHVEVESSPGVHAIFRAVPAATTHVVMHSMERRDRVVFLLLDGRRSVQDVARIIHRSEVDVARTLVRLLKSRYVEYVDA